MNLAFLPYGLLALLAIALLGAAVSDLRHRRIANRLNAAIALLAPVWWLASGIAPAAMLWQMALALGCVLVLGGMFALGLLGGGDVKLLSALALWIRPAWFAQVLAVMALAGGVLALICLASRARRQTGVPYGVAIAIGGWWVLASAYLPLLPKGLL